MCKAATGTHFVKRVPELDIQQPDLLATLAKTGQPASKRAHASAARFYLALTLRTHRLITAAEAVTATVGLVRSEVAVGLQYDAAPARWADAPIGLLWRLWRLPR